jgi:5-formyltetrahydrofolate cyclo-ligase
MAGQLGDAKSALRREMRRVRESMPAAQRERESAEVAAAVLAHPLVDAAHIVHSFIGALPGEIETWELVRNLLDRGKQIVCPRVVAGTRDLDHQRIESLDDLMESALGLWEPGPDCEQIDVATLDVVLVPGLAFDRRGGRLGMGGGYYDRFLAASRARGGAVAIGLCFAGQVVDIVPQGQGDVSLDWVVSHETMDCRREAGND